MNSKRKGCTYKRYLTKDQAYAAQRRMWAKDRFTRAYKCRWCRFWHIAKHVEKTIDRLFDEIATQRKTTK